MQKISYKIFTIAVLMVFATLSRAENSFLVDTVSCSGTSTQSFLDALSFTCTGDLSLDGGSISANSSILLSADGALNLNNLTLTSQDVSLIGGTLISVWSGVDINAANSVTISVANLGEGLPNQPIEPRSGAVLINKDTGTLSTTTVTQIFPGANIMLTSLVPEPDSYALLLLGISLMIMATRAKTYHRNA